MSMAEQEGYIITWIPTNGNLTWDECADIASQV